MEFKEYLKQNNIKLPKISQKEKVTVELQFNKQVNNLWAIRNHIWRLGAIICELKKDGYSFQGEYLRNKKGKLTKVYNYKLN